VHLQAGGTVSNSVGGVISGVQLGIYVNGAAGTVTNAGTIQVTANPRASYAVLLKSGGIVNNSAGGVISGRRGIGITGAAGTVSNAGTITGTVAFLGGGTNRLIVDPGAVFIGTVKGHSSNDVVELAAGASSGTVTGLGTHYVGFGHVTVDAGADWTLAGNSAAATGIALGQNSTLEIAALGSLTGSGGTAASFAGSGGDFVFDAGATVQGEIDGFLAGDTIDLRGGVASGILSLGGGNVLTVPTSGGGTIALHLDPNRNYAQYRFVAGADGFGGSSISTAFDPGPTAANGATTGGHGKTVDLTGFVSSLVTPGLFGDPDTIIGATAQFGTASVAGGVLSYTAPASGPDALTYTVENELGEMATGMVTITIDPGPTAGAAAITLGAGVATDLTSYLLGLDTPGIAGDLLTLSGDNTAGTKGTVSLAGGDLTYTAPATATTDSFGYTVSDQYGETASATVTISTVSLSKVRNGSGTLVLGDTNGSASFGQGKVTVIAGSGDHTITGGNAGNTVVAGNGNDTVTLGQGSNSVTLGSGNDSVTVGNANNTITINGAASSTDTVKAGNGNNTLTLGAGTYNVTVGNGQNTFIFKNGGTYNISAGNGVPDLFVFTVPQGLLNLSFGGNDALVFRSSGFDLAADTGLGTATP
jgi:hypothetical protein